MTRKLKTIRNIIKKYKVSNKSPFVEKFKKNEVLTFTRPKCPNDPVSISYGENNLFYFEVKKQEKIKYKNSVYVMFRCSDGSTESMWVSIISGNQKKGYGKVDNFPKNNLNYNYNDELFYETRDDGITVPVSERVVIKNTTIH